MLRIDIPSDGPSGLDFTKLEQLNLPAPVNGFDQEINNDVILSFEDEQEAIDYAYELNMHLQSINDHNSAEYKATTAILRAISDDEFVQSYRKY